MSPLSDKEVEERLTAAGNSLIQNPSSLDQLLPLLDQIEGLLSKVEQSPAKSMQNALSPLMKALVVEELVKHSNADVKVGVASCISEITRITAPDAPYDDEKMKDVFQLIVSSFEDLSDISSRSYLKRATILETVAKVRSCVIMLDLECDQMIMEMFQHFLKAIRVDHADGIFASMETIMTLVLEESEDISPDLLYPLLTTLKRNNEDVTPVAKKLAERVLQNSADKLRPYLAQAVKSLDASLDDYNDVVASLCQENDRVGHSNESILKDQQVVERKCSSASPAQDPVIQVDGDGTEETHLQDNDSTVIKSPKSIDSNGINETGNEEIMTDANSSRKPDANHQLDAKLTYKSESDDCDAQQPIKLESKTEHAKAQQVQCNHEFPGEDVQDSPTGAQTVEAAKSLDQVKDTIVQPGIEPVNVASPTKSGSLPDEGQSQKDSPVNRKENLTREEIVASVETASKKESEGEYISEAKKQRRSGKKRAEETTDKDEGASKNNDGGTSDSEVRPLDQMEKRGDTNYKTEDRSSLRKKDAKKSGRVKPTFKKDVLKFSAGEDHEKDTVTSPRSPLKSTKDEAIQEETLKTSTKRKRAPNSEKVSETIDYGENLVGSKVKVWWPDDKMFYEGVIASFDSVKKKHKVLYTDGDKEVLNLREERWEFVGDDLVSDGGQGAERSSHDTSSDSPRKKKGKRNSETSSKRQKMEGSPKRKLKDTSTKSGVKSKDYVKAETESKDSNAKASRKSLDDSVKSKDHSQKNGGKSRGGSAKGSGRSKADATKISSHSKQDSPQTPKSKGKTPHSGKTLSGSGSGMPKSSSSKVKGTERTKEKMTDSVKSSETAKGKSTDTAKSRESEIKSGKKRRR